MAKHSRWRADGNDLRRRRKRQAAARRGTLHSAETLEARLALAVDSFVNTGLSTDWVVITGDDADNIFMQRIATGEVGAPAQQDLIYANNGSFLNDGPGTFGQIPNIDSLGTIYVTNGTRVAQTNVFHDQYPLTSTALLAAPWTTTFVLSRAAIEDGETCFGTIAYGGNIWTFTNGVNPNSAPLDFDYPNAAFTFAGPGYPVPGAAVPPVVPIRPIGIGFADAANATGDAIAIVTWSGYPVVTPLAPDPSLTIRYDSNDAQRGPVIDPDPGDPLYVNYNQDFVTDVGRLPSGGALTTFTLPVTNVHPGGIVNGTLRGTIDVTGDGVADFLFAPAQLFGTQENDLVFTNIVTGAGPALTGNFQTPDADSNARTISGSYDPLRGTLLFRFTNGVIPQSLNGLVTIREVSYATYNQDGAPMAATFFAGLDIHNEVYVDLLTSGSTINVESPIIHLPFDQVALEGTELGTSADIDLRATNVNIDATMSAFDKIRIGPSNVPFPQIAQARAYGVIGAAGQLVNIVVPAGGGGLGYDETVLPVTVWIAPPPPGGTQATATALVSNGQVTSVVINNPGAGYLTAPQISIAPPPALPPVPGDQTAPLPVVPGVPSSAWGIFAVVGSDPSLPNFGQIIDVIVPPGGGGQGYNPANPPQVTIAPPPAGGTPATVNAVVVGGVVVGFTITDHGSGYLASPVSPPRVTIAPPNLTANVAPTAPGIAQGFAAIAGGSVVAIAVPPGLGGQGYDPSALPAVFISAPNVAGGVQATATAVVRNGVVASIVMNTLGTGYTTIPAVTIAPPPPLPPIGPGFIDPETRQLPSPRPTGVAPIAEQVSIDAAVAAQFFDIRLGDDPNTAGITRGRLFVSTSGSFSGAIPATPGVVTTFAQRVFVQADNADVLIEGTIAAREQTYLMQSRQADDADPTDGLEPEHAPFLLTTRSPATGSQTGSIIGGTLAVTLGNDTPSPEVGASALNTVDLVTNVDSIRVKAATRAGDPLTGPFPYDLAIAEFDSVAIDAVAASGRPISLSSGLDMRFNAALATGSDLNLTAGGTFTVTAPVSTTRGQIDVVGTSVSVNNSLRVLDPVSDPARDDITLRATGGDINLAGLVSAVNNINLLQANSTGVRPYSVTPVGGLPIQDNTTVEQALTITDDYPFSDVNVVLNAAHPDVGDLTIALVAPNGTTINLFNGQVPGVGFTNTVFDSEAPTTLNAASAASPYTGNFQPVQSLAPLYGGRTAGTWRLRISDTQAFNSGRLLGFGLQFRIAGINYGNVGGATRVVAERLNVEAEGVVSLFTNVDRLDGVAARGFTVNEQDDIAITSLRSGGLVSLRAAGVDRGLENRYTDNAIALTANLIDVTNLEVSAPAGSIEVVADTAKTLVLGRARAIASGLADPMQAAGNVTIRSKAGDVDVLDAPVAGAPQATVRVATTAALVAAYTHNIPGTRSSTLTATTNVSLNAAGIDGVTNLMIGDRILVKDQPATVVGGVTYYPNGIYVVTSLGRSGPAGTGFPWILTRSGDADTTAELPANTRVAIQDGMAQSGRVYTLDQYADALGTVPIVTTVVPNRPDAIRVRAATTASLGGGYAPDPISGVGTITAVANGVLPLIDGIALAVGDRVLVRQGTHTVVDPRTLLPLNTTRVSNGVYTVVDTGSGLTPWILQRIPDMDGLNTSASVTATLAPTATVTVDTSDPVFPSLRVGTAVTGTGIKAGATITAIDTSTGVLTLTPGSVTGIGPSSVTFGAVTELLGYVNVREGTLSTTSVGGAYRVAFDSLGISPLSFTQETYVTEIGSDRLASLVKFVVSSNSGVNAAAGSLGKMIRLRQDNRTDRVLDGVASGDQAMDFRFSTLVTAPIQLGQQLPKVVKPFVIDGGRRYTPADASTGTTSRILIDGSRISRDRFGLTLFTGTLSVSRTSATPTLSTVVVPAAYTQFSSFRVGMLVTGAAIKQGARVTAINPATRTLTLTPGSIVGTGVTSVTIASEVSGVEFGSGSGATPVDVDGDPSTPNVLQSGAVLANVNVGGFANGAAVIINDADGVVVRNSNIGQTVDGSRLSSRFGVLVSGTSKSVTLLNNQIVASSGAGVRVQDTAGRVVMVGNVIGTSLLPNQIGVEILSTATNGNGNRIGVDPILPNRSLAAVTVTRSAAANTITLPVNFASIGDLSKNLGVKGAGIAAGARILTPITPTTRVVTLTLDGSTPGGVLSSGSGSVTFGNFVNTVTNATTLVLPAGVNMADLFLGQGIVGAGIRAATTITAIDVAARTITLSNPLTATATGVSVTFSAPGRNQIAFNRYGVWLAAGSTTVTNSDIFSNVFDGVRIAGGSQKIGTSSVASTKSNVIHSNGGYGVNIVAPAVATSQVIQGNYLGTRAPGTGKFVNGLGNISVSPADGRWTPNPISNVDLQGNVHGPARSTGGGTTTRPPGIHPL